MSSIKIVKCVVRELDPGLIQGEITYEVSFTDTEVRLDLGFVPTLSVLPANRLTTATKTGAFGTSNAKNGYRRVVSMPFPTVRPNGQSVISKTDVFQVPKDALFIDLSPAQVSSEQTAASTWGDPVWTKATAWNSIYAGLDATMELNLDIGSSKVDASDLRFANRAVATLPPPVTTTTRSGLEGGTGGGAFEDTLPSNTVQINRLMVSSHTTVHSLKVEWKNNSGQLIMGADRGATDLPAGNCYQFVFEPGEYITDIAGSYGAIGTTSVFGYPLPDGPTVVRSLQFTTNFNRQFGPFGSGNMFSKSFSFTGLKVVGFFGRAGSSIDQLGVISRTDASTVQVSTTAPAPSPKALEFNGTDTYFDVNTPLPFTTQVTIEMWMRGEFKEAFLFFITDAARRRQFSAHVPYIDGNVYLDSGADGNNNFDRIQKSVGSVDDKNTWNHWAFVRDTAAGRMGIYRNGVLWLDQATGLTMPMATCNRLVIGADGDADARWRHAGAITEVRLWNVVRTEAQIKANMNRRIPGSDTGLIASYALDTYSASQPIFDRSGGGRHGTMRGTAVSVAAPSVLVG